MTKDREAAVVKSLADELSRLAHALPTSGDDDDRFFDESMSIAGIVRALPVLCPHHIEGLGRLAEALLELQGEAASDEQQTEARTVQ